MMNTLLNFTIFASASLATLYLYGSDRSEEVTKDKEIEITAANKSDARIQLSKLLITITAPLSIIFESPYLLQLHRSQIVSTLGIVMVVIAFYVFRQAKIELGKSYSPCFNSRVANDLIQTGIYGYIRHPIYSLNFIMILGYFLISGSAWVLIALLNLFYLYFETISLEEKALAKYLNGYEDYMKRTGRFFLKL